METVSKIRQNRGFFSFFALLALYGFLVFLVITFSGQILDGLSALQAVRRRGILSFLQPFYSRLSFW
jgi:hypothetical protein